VSAAVIIVSPTESRRSHTILSITVHVKEQGVASGGEDLLKVGKFNLVDLAGSEAIGRSGATDKRAREAGMINQSLLTLGRVISALVEKGPHIPYRESKLTRLLQDSLGGKTKTCIVATVSPTRSNMEETLSTLDYAIRAKSIRNRPEINQHLTKTGLLKEYLGDIERLKAEVLAAREKNGIYIPEEQWKEMQDNLAKQKSDYEEAKLKANSAGVELATKKKAFDELCTKMLATTEELVQAREAERQLGELVEEVKIELEESRRRLEEEMVVAQAYERGEERLDQVATGLRDLATESVSDVGGLFDKLGQYPLRAAGRVTDRSARKAKVLGNNADASTRFGSDLQGLSKDLRHGLAKMHSVQGELGKQLEEEMSAHARKGQKVGRDALFDRSWSDLSARYCFSRGVLLVFQLVDRLSVKGDWQRPTRCGVDLASAIGSPR
jgi:kinesin family protein 11